MFRIFLNNGNITKTNFKMKQNNLAVMAPNLIEEPTSKLFTAHYENLGNAKMKEDIRTLNACNR